MHVVMNEGLHLGLVSRHIYSGQVLDERLSPITARRRNYQDQLLSRGRFVNCLLLLNGWSLKILDEDTSWDLSSG